MKAKKFLPNSRAAAPYEMLIRGKVITGRGEGRFYIGKKEYSEQFQKAFGFIPFPGTLNLLVAGENHEKLRMLKEGQNGLIISGFEKDGRRFGNVKCFDCMINGIVKGVVVVPERSGYDDIMEIISDKNLRHELLLNDEDYVDVLIGN
ncbi:MAG: DUF120 domain-containing protein [Nitrospiraceae bacterium]|nr:DUF120 domain-containing protein [Nitrospiraceae bacterium]